MKHRIPVITATAALAAALIPLAGAGAVTVPYPGIQAVQAAQAVTAARQQPAALTPPGHVILRAGGGTLALATTGAVGSPVYAGRFRASNHSEDWHADHEPGGSFPGGRFGFFFAPGGVQTSKYVHAGSATYLVKGAPSATIFTAVPEGGGYVALEYLPGGVQSSGFVLTYIGNGHVILKGAGSPVKPTANQEWKVTG